MGIRRLLVLLLLVLGAVPVASSPAWACSCGVSGGLDGADLAFVGVVRSVQAAGRGERVEFAVESVLKGSAGDVATVRTAETESAACGVQFAQGGRYEVFSEAGRTNLCSGNQMVSTGFHSGDRPSARSAMRWPIILALGAGVLLLVIGGELWWLSRQPQVLAEPGRRASSPA
ncbi:hypothetical protein GCM10010168_40620 [Actinoplanes ianthinogenes]|uniref:Tissue inhibitor of metalloproteinase n=1 Tax=Actinoplanes ianthinogenes TaxID=122358 RepID=A0ABM7LWD9_9ACTN|nr:hypothetical protein [Actinoplanes ianthinogenes]BCJ43630.1 hypothetical protein Aiant_42870 [Actinoplanes ianthinogenes]GGR18750.1 hypothetical protein GCM10010168_40620 [Actinoplanes ianthinogenes]